MILETGMVKYDIIEHTLMGQQDQKQERTDSP
jgi:hypothetical protein